MKRFLMTAAAMGLALAMSGAAYAGDKDGHRQPQRDMHANSRYRFDEHKRYDHRRHGEPAYCEPTYSEPVCSEPCEYQLTFSEACECGPVCDEFPWRRRREPTKYRPLDRERGHGPVVKGRGRGK